MKTVSKALNLLAFFTVQTPEYGLSELSRRSGLDKATTLRMLAALVEHGFVEQHPTSRRYRLGPGLLQLARVREASFPMASLIQPHLDALTAATQETAHASMFANGALSTVATCEPQRTTRVHVEPSGVLPLHATASGIVFLAFGPETSVADVLERGGLEKFTPQTEIDGKSLRRAIEKAGADACAVVRGGFDPDVTGFASPIVDWSGKAIGAVAVAALAARTDKPAEERIRRRVAEAAVAINTMLGASPPPRLVALAQG